ncbi:hypothetical protein phiA047_0060 [Aeromonas phage phiA047]|nr:hypothetical protein phiA047_0060 [Aeromonas phage phiA047]
MARVKYETVEDLVNAVKTDVLTIDNLKRMYYASGKKEQPRTELYREAIFILSLEKLKEQWGGS